MHIANEVLLQKAYESYSLASIVKHYNVNMAKDTPKCAYLAKRRYNSILNSGLGTRIPFCYVHTCSKTGLQYSIRESTYM